MTTKPTTRICPVCGEPVRPGDHTRNTIYKTVHGIPVGDQAHYPACFLKMHPQVRQPIPAQPQLFAVEMH